MAFHQSHRCDCATWLAFIQDYKGISLISPLHDVTYSIRPLRLMHLIGDLQPCCMMNGFRPEDFLHTHINLQEFLPIHIALHVWGHLWSHAVLTFHWDNRAVVDVLAKCTSRDLSVVQAVLAFTLPCSLIINAVHFPGRCNVVVDSLSHSQASIGFERRVCRNLHVHSHSKCYH